jgi:hypothetical protein
MLGLSEESKGENQVSKRAIAYVQSRRLADPDAARVFLLLAERTQASSFGDELAPLGLLVADTDLPGLAAEVGINADRFRNVLRQLRDLVPMDVLEHPDGVWEIVYGPGYTDPPSLPARDGEPVGFRNVFAMPGWESYSTWGRDEPLGLSEHAYLYAQLYRNSDDPDDAPRIWITPPRRLLAGEGRPGAYTPAALFGLALAEACGGEYQLTRQTPDPAKASGQ